MSFHPQLAARVRLLGMTVGEVGEGYFERGSIRNL